MSLNYHRSRDTPNTRSFAILIEGRGIAPSECREINDALDACWDEPDAIHTQSSDLFSELSHGPECFEIEVGGSKWMIHDRRSKYPVFLDKVDATGSVDHIDGDTEVAYGPLFDAVRELVPERDRIDWFRDRHYLIVAGLKCAAAISFENGHTEQMKQFMHLWQELEADWEIPAPVLDTPEEIFERVKDQIEGDAQLASGGLLDARGVSDVDVIVIDLTRGDEDEVFTIDGFDRPVNVRVSSNPDALRSVRHRAIELQLEREFPALAVKARRQKAGGSGTEAAWAEVLGLEGCPYEAMLSDTVLQRAAELAAI
jgi:hypothetical protein